MGVLEGKYLIGELSRAFGLTIRALRYYESVGLLAPRREGVNRVYGQREYQRVRVIAAARRAGLSLAQVRDILDLYHPADRGASQTARAIDYLNRRLEELERQRSTVTGILQQLSELEAVASRRKPPRTGRPVRTLVQG